MKEVKIGISGWRYKGWRKTFYPKGLVQKKELEYASRQLSTIEINGSFYSLQRPESYLSWYDQTPEGFLFSVKANRYITHVKRLNQVDEMVANFFASGVLGLKEKLGPILWQFPPSMTLNLERFEKFLKLLPQNLKQAQKLAANCNTKIIRRPFLLEKTSASFLKRKLSHAIEVRNPSFNNKDFFKMLANFNAALVMSDGAGKWSYFEKLTSEDLVYIRLHGASELYVSGYDEKALNDWARKIKRWQKKHEVFVYFDNDAKVRAPFDAMRLSEILGIHEAKAA